MSEKTIEILVQIGLSAVTLVVGWIIISLLLRLERKALEKSRLDEALYLFVLRASKIILWIVLIIAVLPRFGVNPASLVTVLGAAGAAIALALKDSLSNVSSGIIILTTKPFSKGDTIEVAEITGIVDAIDLLTTQLHTFDNKIVTIPNGTITSEVLVNYSREKKRRVDCVFGISYESDMLEAKEILYQVAVSNELVMDDPEPVVGVSSHGDHAIILDLKVWCSTEDYFDVKYYLEENVKLAFDRAGIGIPYPQMDVHMVE
ncbi:MAG: mechanosensitive ion channel [Emergencia sp.]|nr:mechanosensitive ion channel [Emergencia sp.]